MFNCSGIESDDLLLIREGQNRKKSGITIKN